MLTRFFLAQQPLDLVVQPRRDGGLALFRAEADGLAHAHLEMPRAEPAARPALISLSPRMAVGTTGTPDCLTSSPMPGRKRASCPSERAPSGKTMTL
jgi:hypothetical protein